VLQSEGQVKQEGGGGGTPAPDKQQQPEETNGGGGEKQLSDLLGAVQEPEEAAVSSEWPPLHYCALDPVALPFGPTSLQQRVKLAEQVMGGGVLGCDGGGVVMVWCCGCDAGVVMLW
jgi:hypothetical protein